MQQVIYNHVKCRDMRGQFGQQIIADLPKDWVSEALPFIYWGVDLFQPFLVKKDRVRWRDMGHSLHV